MINLRPHQEVAKKAIITAIDAKENIIVQGPTGVGKTEIATAVIKSLIEQGKSAAFCVPYLSLVNQTVERFKRYGIDDLQILQGANSSGPTDALVSVCSIPTLASRDIFPAVDAAFIDEAHIQNRHTYKWMQSAPHTTFVGLSATPWALGLVNPKKFRRVIKPISLRQLIEQDYLVRPRVFGSSKPDLSGIKVSRLTKDYDIASLGRLMSKPEISGKVVSNWIDRGQGRKTIAFCVDVEHARYLKAEFEAQGIPCGYIDANVPPSERDAIRRALENGDIKIIISIAALIAGFDCPPVSCIIFARPTQSKILFVQALGRGLRASPDTGKVDCLVFDHTGTTSRLGFLEDIEEDADADELCCVIGRDGDDRKKKGDKTKHCEACDAENHADAFKCYHCGWQFPSPVLETDAELSELAPTAPVHIGMSDAQIYAQLEYVRSERGYAPGWIAHSYREVTGKWPSPKVKALALDITEPPGTIVTAFLEQKRRDYREKMRSQNNSVSADAY